MNTNKQSPIVSEVNFTKTYPGFTLSCDFKANYPRTAIFGPSGSGKSTLLNCLSGFANPDKGFIRINGTEVFSSADKINVPPYKRRLVSKKNFIGKNITDYNSIDETKKSLFETIR